MLQTAFGEKDAVELSEENKRLQSKVEKNEKTLKLLKHEVEEHDAVLKVMPRSLCTSMSSETCTYYYGSTSP